MFDLNAIVNAAIATAVDARLTEVLQQHANIVGALAERITALENNPAIDALETKLTEAKLFEQTTNVTIPIDEAKMVEALNSQEWFWEKLRRTTDAQIEQAMDDHCSTYDHDDYDNVVSNWNDEDPTEFVREGDLSSQINDVLNGASFDVRISI